MPQQRATSANNGLPQRFGTSPCLVFDTFRFVTSIAGQSRAKSFGHAERRQALTLCAMDHDDCEELIGRTFNPQHITSDTRCAWNTGLVFDTFCQRQNVGHPCSLAAIARRADIVSASSYSKRMVADGLVSKEKKCLWLGCLY
jgi:hypothetical protein